MGRRNLKAKKAANKVKLDELRRDIARFCGIGGKYSTLELVVIASAKLNLTVRGDIHPNGQLRFIHKKIAQFENRKFRCKTLKDFYSSRAWKILRYQAFEKYGNKCQCCGATPEDGITLHVDHIKPKSTNPELALDLNNLQILCEPCNIGKINQWDTDWRP